jgi:hypothetical protein
MTMRCTTWLRCSPPRSVPGTPGQPARRAELAVRSPDCSDVAAVRPAEDLGEAVRRSSLRLADESLLPLTVSVGVAHFRSMPLELRDLYAAAAIGLPSRSRWQLTERTRRRLA